MSKNLPLPAPRRPITQAVRRALLTAPIHLVLPLASPQLMASTATDSATRLDQIKVEGTYPGYGVKRSTTLTKTDTPLLDTPQSITVINEDLIRDQAMQNMGDVVRYVPGVQMAQGEGHRDAPILRGNTTTADFFINGVRDDVQYYRDLYNVQSVEVLKGPSGMIFGRGGSGGLINRVTKQADWNETRDVSLTLGSWDARRLTGDINHAVSEDVAFRVTGLYEDSDSYRDEVTLERWAVNPTLTFRAGDATTVELGYEHFEDDRITDRGIPSYLGRPLDLDESTFVGSAGLSPTWVDIDALNAVVRHDFGNGVNLVNHTRYADYDKYYQTVFAGTYSPAAETIAVSAYANFTNRKNFLNQTDITFDVQTGSVEHRFLVGAELGTQDTGNFRTTGYFTAIGPDATSDVVTLPNTIYTGPVQFRQSASDADNDSTAQTVALYVQDQIEFSPQWQAILGVRYDRFDAELDNRRNGVSFDSTDGLLSPRAGLVYKPQDNVSLYTSYSIAYLPRAGEQLASLTASNRALEPEKFTNVEFGAKWDVGDRLALTAAIYQLDRTNVVIVDPNNPAASLLVDGQRVEGLELGASGNITEAWQVSAGYAYQDSKIQTPGGTNGNELGQVPEHSLAVWNRYNFNDAWGAGLGAIYQSDVFVAADNAVTLPGFTRFDGAVFYTVNPSLRLQLNVENLADERYYASAHSNTNIMPGSPRAFRLGMDVRF